MRLLPASLLVLIGCGQTISPGLEDGTGDVVLALPDTARERLELEVREFRALPLDSGGSFSSRRVLAQATSAVPLAIADGWFDARARYEVTGPKLRVTRFAATLHDVRFTEAQLPPTGLTLTQVRFSMPEPATLNLRWFGDGTLGWASGAVTVEVHARLLRSNGLTSPLEVARLEALPVELLVSQTEAGVLALTLRVDRPGALWNWAGLLELGDLSFSLRAFEVTPLDQLPPRPGLN